MPYKNKEDRKKNYQEHKDEINNKRRENAKKPEVKEKIRKRQSKWRENNRELANKRSRESKKKYEVKCKEEVFNYYGKRCVCCGEKNPAFLTIDHINGNGNRHRKKIKEKITVWLYRNNFPVGFQTLCFNCNWGKYFNGGICPHKEKINSNILP